MFLFPKYEVRRLECEFLALEQSLAICAQYLHYELLIYLG